MFRVFIVVWIYWLLWVLNIEDKVEEILGFVRDVFILKFLNGFDVNEGRLSGGGGVENEVILGILGIVLLVFEVLV